MGGLLCLWGSFFSAEKRKACFLPATRKRLFANSDFALQQRPKVSKGRPESPLVASAEAKSFVMREKKVRPVSCLPQGSCFIYKFLLAAKAEGFQRAIGKPFGRLRRGETLCDTEKKGRPFSCLLQEVCFSWEVLPTHIRMGPEGVQGAIGKPPGRLRRGDTLCDAGRRKVGPFPACRKEFVSCERFRPPAGGRGTFPHDSEIARCHRLRIRQRRIRRSQSDLAFR